MRFVCAASLQNARTGHVRRDRTFGDEPFGVSQLVRRLSRERAARLLERVLAHGEAPAADLAALQAALAEEGRFDCLSAALRFAS